MEILFQLLDEIDDACCATALRLQAMAALLPGSQRAVRAAVVAARRTSAISIASLLPWRSPRQARSGVPG